MSEQYREIQVTPEAHGFGAAIRGLSLREALSETAVAEIKRAWTAHSVIYFPDQPMAPEELERFTEQMGPYGEDPYVKPMDGHPHILEVKREATETARNFGAGWHSDWSFQPTPPSATILHAKVIPPVGGDTWYADCYRAYDALSDVMKDMLDGLRAIHSAALPYGREGFFAKDKSPRAMEIVSTAEAEKTHIHPLIRRHGDSGRACLFVNPVYTVAVDGMHAAESEALLGYLYKHMTQEQFVYRHAWREDMLTMWDNRCVLHSAQGGYDGHRRLLHRTVVAGETPIAA